MHRDKWSDVGAVEPRHPLQEPSRPIYQLHICRRKPRVDMAAKRNNGFIIPEIHKRSDRLRADIARERSTHCTAATSNHPRTDAVQTECERGRIRSYGHYVFRIYS